MVTKLMCKVMCVECCCFAKEILMHVYFYSPSLEELGRQLSLDRATGWHLWDIVTFSTLCVLLTPNNTMSSLLNHKQSGWPGLLSVPGPSCTHGPPELEGLSGRPSFPWTLRLQSPAQMNTLGSRARPPGAVPAPALISCVIAEK